MKQTKHETTTTLACKTIHINTLAAKLFMFEYYLYMNVAHKLFIALFYLKCLLFVLFKKLYS